MDIYTILKNDHVEVKELLDELIALKADDDYRMVLIEQIEKALIPHARAEESVLYNSIRALKSDTSAVMHSYKEHATAETYLRALQIKDKADLEWKATAEKLRIALNEHIQEEEGKIFTEARNLFSDDEANMMGAAFEELKAKVEKEGFLKTSFDMVVNLMPPRFIEKVRGLKSTDTFSNP